MNCGNVTTRSRTLAVVTAIALLPLATAIFIRPAPLPPKEPAAPTSRPSLSIQPPGTYAIDAVIIDGRVVAPVSRTLRVKRGQSLFVAGWALDTHTMDEAAGLAVSIDRGTPQRLAGYGLPRSDVAMALGIPEAGQSGFRARVPIERLGPGMHVLQLFLLVGDDRSTIIPTAIAFSVER
jgi:hypothetical protein